ncbi:hypothetical protein DN41_3316 [Vibrio cholerae]|nr:hypothetical protein DN41_3316 [Vibrio cholerae]KFE11207.1 hypothetical protein DN37_3272 [Vibrio cholerae]
MQSETLRQKDRGVKGQSFSELARALLCIFRTLSLFSLCLFFKGKS